MYCKNLRSLSNELTRLSSGIAIVLALEKNFNYEVLQSIIRNCSIPVVGAFFPGVISEGEVHYSGFIIQHLDLPFELEVCDLKRNNPEFSKRKISTGTGLIFMDGLADGKQRFLKSVANEFGSKFKFVGSGAGSLDLVQKPCVFDQEGIYEDKGIIILIKEKVAVGMKHGYERIAGLFVATKIEQGKIIELNWQNAFDTFALIYQSYQLTEYRLSE